MTTPANPKDAPATGLIEIETVDGNTLYRVIHPEQLVIKVKGRQFFPPLSDATSKLVEALAETLFVMRDHGPSEDCDPEEREDFNATVERGYEVLQAHRAALASTTKPGGELMRGGTTLREKDETIAKLQAELNTLSENYEKLYNVSIEKPTAPQPHGASEDLMSAADAFEHLRMLSNKYSQEELLDAIAQVAADLLTAIEFEAAA